MSGKAPNQNKYVYFPMGFSGSTGCKYWLVVTQMSAARQSSLMLLVLLWRQNKTMTSSINIDSILAYGEVDEPRHQNHPRKKQLQSLKHK